MQNSTETAHNSTNIFLQSTIFTKLNTNKKLHIVGLGGAGSNVVEYLQTKNINAKFTCISNLERPQINSNINFINIKDNSATKSQLSLKINDIFNKDENYLLISGLGGETGTLLTVAIAIELHKKAKLFNVISFLPFKFEKSVNNDSCPQQRSLIAIEKMTSFHNIFYFRLEKIKIAFDKKMNFKDFFLKINEELADFIQKKYFK